MNSEGRDGASCAQGAQQRWTEKRVAELVASDPQFAAGMPDTRVSAALKKSDGSLAGTLQILFEGYADRPAFGSHKREILPDGSARLVRAFETTSYQTVWKTANATASALRHSGPSSAREGDIVASLGFVSADYAVVEIAALLAGAVHVALHHGASAERLAPVIAETAPRVLATSVGSLDTAVDIAASSPSIAQVLVFDLHPGSHDDHLAVAHAQTRLLAAGRSLSVETLAEAVARGEDCPPLKPPNDRPDAPAWLCYTSGSTGSPKGVVIESWKVAELFRQESPYTAFTLACLPMSHSLVRNAIWGALASGGTCFFTAAADLSSLLQDFELARITHAGFVPRIWDMLHREYQRLRERGLTEAAAKTHLREHTLGGRVLSATNVSAPLPEDMAALFGSLLHTPLYDSYGSTELGVRALQDGRVRRPDVIDYKLVDIPELGYTAADRPHPRGELYIKTRRMFQTYYKQPKLSATMFDEDGFYKTGDIFEHVGDDTLRYIDRSNNVLKLAQGEFVAIAHIEAVLSSADLLQQIYVYGKSDRPYLLAVVVPTAEAMGQFQGDALRCQLMESIQARAREAGLQHHETPRDILVEPEPFTPENELLTAVRKLARPKLKNRYAEQLEALYRKTAAAEQDAFRELRENGQKQPVLQTVLLAASAASGAVPSQTLPQHRFADLGGDSLSAISFTNLLSEIYSIEIPTQLALSATADLDSLATWIERRRTAEQPASATFASVHGAKATRVRADELQLEKFLGSEMIANAADLPRNTDAPATVLVTGANGFLGRFLLLELLEQLPPRGRVIACARARDDEHARDRILRAYGDSDPQLVVSLTRADERWSAVAGDLAEPRLGLDEDAWNQLAAEVDLIVHAGALVNHILPYEALFSPNVAGTAELIRLALVKKRKPLAFVSTIGVGAVAPGCAESEAFDVRAAARHDLDGTHADGYCTSKWASEILLRQANEATGLPVTVFRCSEILTHRRYLGQLNLPEHFTRWLYSLLVTGIAPQSFYTSTNSSGRAVAHLDALPGDFVAAAIVSLTPVDGFRTYNVTNNHDDSVSFDTIVDWLIEAGHRIERIGCYRAWFSAFSAALQALPPQQRKYSLLPLLQLYKQPIDRLHRAPLANEQFQFATREHAPAGDTIIPPVTKELVLRYPENFRLHGLLPPAEPPV
jgi:fatty acid CoA ligase FadD9